VNGSRDDFPPGDEFADSKINASFGKTVDCLQPRATEAKPKARGKLAGS